MREHYRLVLSQCRRMLGVIEDAEDVTQWFRQGLEKVG